MTESTDAAPAPRPGPRMVDLRFPIAAVAFYWFVWLVSGWVDKSYFHGFMTQLATTGLFVALFFGWWFFNRALSWKQKLLGFSAIAGCGLIAGKLIHPSVNPFLLFRIGVPLVGLLTVAWMIMAARRRAPLISPAWAALVALAWVPFLLVRGDGMDSRLAAALNWRWSLSAEEVFLARSPQAAHAVATFSGEPAARDWTSFRGPNRDGIAFGTTISTNWNDAPPQLVWRKAVGPAWSTFATVGQWLFTQEQRGPNEAVACYNAETGEPVWVHEDPARFEETLSGIGPRATPTFEKGRLYTLGATGLLNCLDAATGKSVWKRDIRADSGAPLIMWGFSSSPLVVEGKVIVYAGGAKGLLAYAADTGDLLWATPAGETSYSSAQVTVIDGVPQCLMLHDGGLMGADLATGKKLWETGLVFKGGPRSCQPRLTGPGQLVVGALNGPGTSLIQVTRAGGAWAVSTNWISRDLKPEFPDFVVHNGHAYGFDLSLFCCINLADGKRAWKEGRYGRGQVTLLADQNALLVVSEIGDLVLLAADPAAHRELGRLKALTGKTWASAVARGNRIFVRNAQEMACYTSGPSGPKIAAAGP